MHWTAGVVLALAVAVTLRTFVAAPFRVPSDSMAETLLSGDHVWVDRLSAHIRPFRRGDVVVFAREGQWHVKRVLAVGSDSVVWQRGTLRVGGLTTRLPQAALGGWAVACEDRPLRTFAARSAAAQRLAGACALTPDVHAARDTALIVPAGSLYVVGDHRTASEDSRTYGAVPETAVVGRVLGVYLSLDPTSGTVRWDRMGRLR